MWDVLLEDTLSVAFLPAGRITGKGHATMVRKYYKHWASEYKGVFHDGETALHSPPAQAAYSAVGAPCNKLPPYPPDLNAIKNAWALPSNSGRGKAAAIGGFANCLSYSDK